MIIIVLVCRWANTLAISRKQFVESLPRYEFNWLLLWIKWWWLFGSVHRCKSYKSNERMAQCMATSIKMLLYIVSTAFCKHLQTFIFTRFSFGCNANEKLQTIAIFLNFWSTNIGECEHTNSHMYTFQAWVLPRRMELFSRKQWSKRNGRTETEIAFDSNKWELVAFCVKDRIVLILMWLSLATKKRMVFFRGVKNSNELKAPFTYWPHPFSTVAFSIGWSQSQNFVVHTPTCPIRVGPSHRYRISSSALMTIASTFLIAP